MIINYLHHNKLFLKSSLENHQETVNWFLCDENMIDFKTFYHEGSFKLVKLNYFKDKFVSQYEELCGGQYIPICYYFDITTLQLGDSSYKDCKLCKEVCNPFSSEYVFCMKNRLNIFNQLYNNLYYSYNYTQHAEIRFNRNKRLLFKHKEKFNLRINDILKTI